MRKFSLGAYRFQVDKQLVHMDQGACYCPEYLATRAQCHYPSRVAQVARAVWLGQLPASEYGADMVFSSILSGQGERWQNFGEDQNDYLLCMMLFREMFVNKKFKSDAVNLLHDVVKENSGHIMKVSQKECDLWKESLPLADDSTTCLFVDDATFACTSHCAYDLGVFLKSRGITVQPQFGPFFGGFEYFATGLIDEGYQHLLDLVQTLQKNGVRKVITLSGQSQYLLTTLCDKLGIRHELHVESALSLCDSLDVTKGYIYGGSFFTRYLRMEGTLNQLSSAPVEHPVANSWEFVPLIQGENRVNKVTIWQAPVSAEYISFGAQPGILDKIYEGVWRKSIVQATNNWLFAIRMLMLP
jgi:hypothetical protein